MRVADVEFFYYYFNYYEHVYYFKTHLRMADNSALVHKEGALDRHQVTALVSFHVQYLTLAFTFLLGLVSIALKTFIYKKEGINTHAIKKTHIPILHTHNRCPSRA